jgi:pimeloyl-ACP methyl ester carboxylesterase
MRRIGYRPAVCGFITNTHCSERALERVERHVDAPHAASERRVAIVGHSRGGHFARAVAARRPEPVSHAVSLGADLQAMFHRSAPTLAAVEGARRLAPRTGRVRREECLTYRCDCSSTAGFRAPFPQDRVRLTSVYSKRDGVVRWQAQLVPYATCVEVTGSHVGLIFNRTSYRAIANAIAAPELARVAGRGGGRRHAHNPTIRAPSTSRPSSRASAPASPRASSADARSPASAKSFAQASYRRNASA